jgi:tetratricopeptide (TPR) repeat protein
MKLNKAQVSVIIGSVIVIVLLLFANTKLPKKEVETGLSDHAGSAKSATNNLFEETKNGLSQGEKQTFNKLESALTVSSDKAEALENSVRVWDSLQQPVLAAHYKEQQAIAFSNEKTWEGAGNRYYSAAHAGKEESRSTLYDKAIECFEKTVQLNPGNTNAKIDLASCYVERGSNPMQGISMLREIEKTDSNNVKLQLSFAFFSLKSGQWDKAIKRFEKVLKLQPDYSEVYWYLADAYTQKGEKVKTIESLEKYVASTKDKALKKEVQGYIDKLKTN